MKAAVGSLWTSTYGHVSIGVNNNISVFLGVLEEHLQALCLFNLAHPIKLLSSRKDLRRLQSCFWFSDQSKCCCE